MLMLRSVAAGAAVAVVVLVATVMAAAYGAPSLGGVVLGLMIGEAGATFVGGGLAGYVYGRGAAASGTYGGSAIAGLLAGGVPAVLPLGWLAVQFGGENGLGWLLLLLAAPLCAAIGGVIGHATSRKVLRSRSR